MLSAPNRHRLLLLAAAALLAFSAAPGQAVAKGGQGISAATRQAVLSRLQKAEGKNGTAGCVVIDLDSGETLVSHNPGALLAPASNMKLITSGAALHELGADFEFVTRVLGSGALEKDVWKGDLCVVGGGDPNLSGRFYEGDPLKLFRDWAQTLAAKGITRVEGDFLYDSTLYGGDAFHPDWPQDDQYIRWYCAEVSALAFNDNCIGIRVTPGKAGGKATLETVPPTGYVTLLNETTTTKGKGAVTIDFRRDRDSNTITVRGSIPETVTSGYTGDVTVHDPARFAAAVLRETLEAEGIAVSGETRAFTITSEELKAFETLVEHRASLAQALGPINTNSQNLHAEMLFRMLGLKYAGKGTFPTGGEAAAAALEEMELAVPGMALRDGSGLARTNLVTAGMLASLLANMAERDDFETFRASLAVSGESGTLSKRLKDDRVRGKVFAKTGTISGVSALSGYLFVGDRRLAFSILTNDCVSARQAQDDILLELARALE